MKMQYKKFTSRLSQAGSLMVEAMAMLALISLVTPTLYKKSAERTTELQDINTATHVRTVMKAVDNYAAANYQELIKDLGEGQVKHIDIDDETYASFFPYGYKFDDLKNFGKPKVALRRQGNSITSFVEFPKSLDIGEMRAARIASMVGSNGGYVDGTGVAKGVGGIWNLNSADLNALNFDGTKGSVVVASSDAINSANSAALENEKYLQRTKVESEDQKWRNAMTTNLYMGGVAGADTMYKILGVDQMIIGSTDTTTNQEDLVITAESSDGGSAWLAGSLSAVSDAFKISGNENEPVLTLAGDENILSADSQNVDIYNDGASTGLSVSKGTMEILTDYDTTIENNLHVSGDTEVATGDSTTTFKAGPDGSYLSADNSAVNLLGGNVIVSRAGTGDDAGSATNINTKNVNITGDTKMGVGDVAPARIDLNPKLNVQGNAFVSNILEAGEIDTSHFKALELHAGGESYVDGQQWLNATATGVTVNNPKLAGEKILDIDAVTSALYGPHGDQAGTGPAVIMGDTNAQMRGQEFAAVYSTDADGYVTLQHGVMRLQNTYQEGAANTSTVDINAAATSVNEGIFQVQGSSVGGDGTTSTNTSLYVDPVNGGLVEVNAKNTKIASETLEINTNPLFNVMPESLGGFAIKPEAVSEIRNDNFRVSTVVDEHGDRLGDAARKVILDVDVSVNPDITGGISKDSGKSGVYIRRGAIEVESNSEHVGLADAGYGYVEAGRFVSNALGDDGNIAPPVYAGDYGTQDSGYYKGTPVKYDRYLVNPAYTSVMHDIKLTTRGGARLSDILPDFINKGIYVVNNTYLDNININNITALVNEGRVYADGAKEVFDGGGSLSGVRKWASPFLGIVPAPQCPPGYARVITITPAGFMMSQAGSIVKEEAYVYPGTNGTTEKRYVIDTNGTKLNELDFVTLDPSETITGAKLNRTEITDQAGSNHVIYYLGHASEPGATKGDAPYSPEPLYFQQSTWLKSKVMPQRKGVPGPCNTSLGSGECGKDFVGWSTIMGFIYPSEQYSDIIHYVTGQKKEGIYWNVFPVMAQTLEAYATVYCYFDRTNLYSSGQNSTYVDPYDQLNNFRTGYEKEQNNADYINRLDDPSLEYKEPW